MAGEPLRQEAPDATATVDATIDPHMADRVVTLARLMVDEVLAGVLQDIETRESDPRSRRDVAKKMASHCWCTLFVALVRALETYGRTWRQVRDAVEHEVNDSLRARSGDQHRIVGPFVGDLVGRACDALIALAETGDPLLALANSPEVLRALRILAIFCCPASERHPEIVEHCVRPLQAEARDVLREETSTRLREAFGIDIG